ncbi:MAG TPA: NADH-quinone oxidoreductase subunit L, partial [Acidobacteriaceae bacterium]|nr:NADH-quinone oxidoreductase subunit L [Acidobacteriaceae bacterium]
ALVTAVALLFTALPFGIVLKLASTMFAAGGPESISVVGAPWIAVSGFQVNFSFAVDHLTLIMLGVVTGVGFLIHLYSAGYMAHEEGYWRFFAYLNLFMFFMLVLVLAANFLLLFVGWEGVGLASYLLIGFYFTKDSAANAGKKAFIVNRIGDFGFLLAMFLLIAHFGSLSFSSVFMQIGSHPELQGGFLTAIALLLMLGAAGKSAQIPLYIWLPDAMEGPTPVSALIHAATMVTAGIYMVARTHVIFDRSAFALGVVAITGAATAIFAASIGMVQTDIKRVLAYSTVSQLGYMFLACGVAAYSAAIFHLVTHAFFKALLFLAAGSVIHALGGEQDMRRMGGLRHRIPVTFWTMTAGVFAIAGFPPLAGFFSKDEILYHAFVSPNPLGKLLWAVGLITALMTSFYMFRLWYLTFFGAQRFEDHPASGSHADSRAHSVHESPWIMLAPLVILALLAFSGGWLGIPEALGGSNHFEHFLAPVFTSNVANAAEPIQALHAGPVDDMLERVLAAVSVLAAVLGLLLADYFYRRRPDAAPALAKKLGGLYTTLVHKYWVDEIYAKVIVLPILMFSRFFLFYVVDKGVVEGSAAVAAGGTRGVGSILRRMQSGNIRSYAGWLAAGAAILLAVTIFGRAVFLH